VSPRNQLSRNSRARETGDRSYRTGSVSDRVFLRVAVISVKLPQPFTLIMDRDPNTLVEKRLFAKSFRDLSDCAIDPPATAGGSVPDVTRYANAAMLSPALRADDRWELQSWGSAALHSRNYAFASFAGSRTLSLPLPFDLSRRRNAHYSMIVAIQTVGQLFDLAAFFLHSHGKTLVRSVPLYAQRQIAF